MSKSVVLPLLTLMVALSVALVPLSGAQTAPATAPATTVKAPVTATAPVNRKKTDQMRGFSMRLVDPSEQGVNSYLKAIDELADMGCTWIDFPISAYQDNVRSESIALDSTNSLSETDNLRVMKHAKDRGMGIMIMPTVLLKNSGAKDWRGVINPPDGEKGWDNWFASYTKFITRMADLAQKGNVDILVVGSELLSTEPWRERWIETIKQIKKIYKGKLTYSSNWDHYEAVTFWDQLDYIGMNNYHELASKPGVPLSKVLEAWVPIKKNILEFAAKQNKPFMFTEVGWHNLSCTLNQPWNYVAEGPVDYDEQQKAFQSFVQTWQNVPNSQFMGAFVWEWYPGGKFGDRGTYSLQGTPALEVVKKWFAMP